MKETLLTPYGGLGIIVGFGTIVIILFICLRFFKAIFTFSLIGLLGALCSYFVYDYMFNGIPVIACAALLLSATGFNKHGIINKLIATCGVALSGYIILHCLGYL